MQDHHKLKVWQRAHALAVDVRRAGRGFPRVGYASLLTQMVRAAESVVLNIVEGCSSKTRKEFARFLDISIKSSSELEGQLELARDYGILPPRNWVGLTTEVVEIRRMLCGLRARVLAAEQSSISQGRGREGESK